MCWREFYLAQYLWYWLFVQASLVQILPRYPISAMHSFVCFFVTDFVRKMEARPELAKEPLVTFNVQKWTFCPKGFLSSVSGVLRETTASSMAASQIKYNT